MAYARACFYVCLRLSVANLPVAHQALCSLLYVSIVSATSIVSVIDSVWKADTSNEWFMNTLMKQREASGRPCTIINTHKDTV